MVLKTELSRLHTVKGAIAVVELGVQNFLYNCLLMPKYGTT